MAYAWTERAIWIPGLATPKLKAVLPTVARPAISAAFLLTIVAGPLAVAAFVLGLDGPWRLLVHVSDAITAWLYAVSPSIRENPGQTAEALRIVLGAALAAVPPSLAIVAFEPRWTEKAMGVIVLYPSWLLVSLAPAAVLHQFSHAIDPTRLGSHLSADFLVLFSAASTSIALGFSRWAQQPDVGFVEA